MKYVCLLLLSCCLLSCEFRLNRSYDLSAAKVVETGKLLYEASEVGSLVELQIQDSLLIALDALGDQKFIVLDLVSGEEKMRCGKKGRGLGEFLTPEFLRNTGILNQNAEGLMLYDPNTRCFYRVDFNRWLRGEEGAIAREQIPAQVAENSYLNLFPDKIIGGNTMPSDSGMIVIYDRKTKQQDWIGYYPGHREVAKGLYSYVYDLKLMANAQTDRIIGGMTFADLILVYDTSGKLYYAYQFSENDSPNIDPQTQMLKANTPAYFAGCYAGKKSCYFLRVGYDTDSPENRKQGVYIIQLDWEGNLIATYKVNDYLYGFCVDEVRNKLLGIVSEDGDIYRILEYRL